MNSSTGFKKRALLRPVSGVLNREKQLLKCMDISQSEALVGASFRSELATIQEQINLLDKDRMIRAGDATLERSYAGPLRKQLREMQRNIEKEEDDAKILRHMGVESYEAGFRKLWRLVGHLDLMISKITELQIVQFLRYDEMFQEIAEDSARATSILSTITKGGYAYGLFQITQVSLDRSRGLFEICKRGPQKRPDNTSGLIAMLQEENAKLAALLGELTLKKESSQELIKPQTQAKEAPAQSGNKKDIFDEIDQKYAEQFRKIQGEKRVVQERVNELSAKLITCETQLRVAEGVKTVGKAVETKAGSYEEALLQEMDKMKRGFQRKIAMLSQELTNREKENRKKQGECRTENEKLKWEKSLLLKKFQALSSK